MRWELINKLCYFTARQGGCPEAVLSQVFELRAEIQAFLEEERMYDASDKFSDEQFLMKLDYLSDVFGKLNELNFQLQDRDKHLPYLADKITAFIRKLKVWGRHFDQGNTDAFEDLSEIAETSTSGATTVHVSNSTDLH